MKLWKPILLTASLLTTIISTTVLTSCERNSCDGITCYNGGSCGNGLCRCLTGYEGTQCEYESRSRYLGVYGGFLECNNGAQTIDTVRIYPANRGKLSVDVYLQSIKPKVLQGYVSSNSSTYSVIILNNDSSKANTIQYLRTFDITLQGDKTLTLHKYEYEITDKVDTFVSQCTFVGDKTKLPLP